MKQILLNFATISTIVKRNLLSLVFIFVFLSANAQIWVNPITTGRPIATNYLGDKLSSSWPFNFEIGQTSWNASDVGIGQNSDGSTGWSWESALYYANGAGSNKRVRRDIGNFQFTATGTWYVVGRARANSGDAWTYADEEGWSNETTLTASTTLKNCPYFTVSALVDPTSCTASITGTTATLGWTKFTGTNTYNVMIVRYAKDATPTAPTNTTAYALNATLGTEGNTGTVIYATNNGVSTTNTVAAETNYDYYFYSVNGSYYSAGQKVTALAPTTTWDGSVWSNGTPSASLDAIIDGNLSSTGTLTAKSLTVNSTKTLTVASGSVTVAEAIVNNGTITVENNANLIQTAVANSNSGSGTATVKRNSAALKRLDYTMWSSPVSGQNLLAFSPLTSLSPSRFYTYNSTANLYNEIVDPIVYSFLPSIGVLVRMPNTAVTAPTTEIFTGVFTGVPNNGTVNLTGLTSNSYYAVGNPYASTISAESFLAGNATDGILYFWRKTNAASGSAYATYTAGGATSTTASSEVPNGTIQVGEGFIVKTGVAATSLTFTNAMREANPTSTQFFKTKKLAAKDRVWLNLTNTDGVFSQALVGYMAGATQGVDAGIDGKYINDSPVALTSNINNEEYTIQLRGSFDASDVVPLNFKTDKAGDYTIAIDHTEGVFASDQDVILFDSTTGIETSLKASPYTFTSAAGTNNLRFALKYQKTLGTNQSVLSDNNVTVYKNKGVLFVNAGDSIIANIEVYDVQGKLVVELKNVKATSVSIPNLKLTNQVLVVKITSQDNKVITKKVVN